MKKVFLSILVFVVFLSLSACSNSQATDEAIQSTPSAQPDEGVQTQIATGSPTLQATEQALATVSITETAHPTEQSQKTGDSKKVLVAYFSRAGENYNVGFIEKGNTQVIAEVIAEKTGGDLFKIETVIPYPESYDETTDIAKREQEENARPELSTHVENMDQYDIILLGYPNWYGTMPMAVFTFLEEYDFSGKTIIPFCTHEGSGLGRSESDIASLVPDVILREGLAIRGSNVNSEQAQQEVTNWLRKLGLIQ